MLIVRILLAVAACSLIICVLHYFFSAAFRPKQFLAFVSDEQDPAKKLVYFWAVLIGCCLILFPGFDTLLSWIPLSWGAHTDEGGFAPARHTIAALLTSLVFPLLSYVENSAQCQVARDQLSARVIELERELATATRAISTTA